MANIKFKCVRLILSTKRVSACQQLNDTIYISNHLPMLTTLCSDIKIEFVLIRLRKQGCGTKYKNYELIKIIVKMYNKTVTLIN